MNKRDYKVSGEGYCFHIYNRGNNLQDIFLDDEDYNFFILRLKQNLFPDEISKRMSFLPLNAFSLLSYCLMPNHFHLLLRQNNKYTIQQLILRICSSYSKYFNKKYKRIGHVFQDRFKQVHIEDDDQLLWAHAYINLNPVVDELTDNIKSYPWSSYKEFFDPSVRFCDESFIYERLGGTVGFEKFVEDALPVLKMNKKLRQSGLE